MRKLFLSITLTSLLLSGVAFAEDTAKIELSTEKAKQSYLIGRQMGESLKNQGIEVESKTLNAAINEALAGKKSQISPEQAQLVMQGLQKEAMAKAQAAAEKNKEKGKAFLATNSKAKGVKTTPSGLQYIELKPGTGKSPKATDKVKVHYKGTLIDGTEFDSSYKRNKPAEFFLNQVVKGWTEGIPLMKVGGKTKFFIPSDLGYGPRGGRSIPGNSVLIFEVELLDILSEAKG